MFAASAKDGGDAARVTDTPGAEEQITWASDSRHLAYSSDRDGAWHIWVYDFATRRDTEDFTEGYRAMHLGKGVGGGSRTAGRTASSMRRCGSSWDSYQRRGSG